jgi:predicted nuclease of predicted toxin-antitoxin system
MDTSALRFLADESCDFAVVRALRAVGYDVLAVSEVTQRSVDSDIIEQSAREQRILFTEDKDFGWLVFVSRADSAGVILIRFPGNAREALAQLAANQIPKSKPNHAAFQWRLQRTGLD